MKPKALFADAVTAHGKGVSILPPPFNGGIQQIKFGKESYRCNGGNKKSDGRKLDSQIFLFIQLRKTRETISVVFYESVRIQFACNGIHLRKGRTIQRTFIEAFNQIDKLIKMGKVQDSKNRLGFCSSISIEILRYKCYFWFHRKIN